MAPSVTNFEATNTTSIVHMNSVTHLPIKLAGIHNFSLWKAQVSLIMRGHNLYGHLDGTINALAETTNNNNLTISNPHYVNWFQQDKLIQNSISATLDTTLAAIIAVATNPKQPRIPSVRLISISHKLKYSACEIVLLISQKRINLW